MSVEEGFDESTLYGIYNALFHSHSLKTTESFLVFPQLYLPWKPQSRKDAHRVVPDFAFGRLLRDGTVVRKKIQGGAELKAPLESMKQLPHPTAFVDTDLFRELVTLAAIQAEDQIKAAMKSRALGADRAKWIIGIGPYFLFRNFGPFSPDELDTRGHRPNPSGDSEIADLIARLKKNARNIHVYEKIFCLGTKEAAVALHKYFEETFSLY